MGKTTVREHPRNNKSGRSTVKRHDRKTKAPEVDLATGKASLDGGKTYINIYTGTTGQRVDAFGVDKRKSAKRKKQDDMNKVKF